MPWWGIVYILEQIFDCRKGHISSIHTLIAIFEFGNDFDKTTILRHFHQFIPRQKSPHITQKSHQTLENKAFPRTQPKITLLIRNFHLTNYQKFNRKISQTPVKSILLLSNANQNFTLLSKSKNLSYHKSHNEYNQKNTIISHSNREYINIAINNNL